VDNDEGLIVERTIALRPYPVVKLFRDAMYASLKDKLPPDVWDYWYTDAPEELGGVTSAAVNGIYGYNNYNGLVTTFKTSAIGAVPEPASWAMMIAGFGFVGASLRRAKIKPVLA